LGIKFDGRKQNQGGWNCKKKSQKKSQTKKIVIKSVRVKSKRIKKNRRGWNWIMFL
jgi:hypothetical protein